jgi:hypothetical protein
MKTSLILIFAGLIIFNSCDSSIEKGSVQISIKNPVLENYSAFVKKSGFKISNPPLAGDTTITLIESLKICIGDIWISKDEISPGTIDNLNWVKLTTHTNFDLKLFEEYQFDPVMIESGTYKSIKISSKNLFYRHCVVQNNPSVVYDIPETQSNDLSPCIISDSTWAQPIYISLTGNYTLLSGTFQLISAAQKINGFKVNPGEVTGFYWSFGDESTIPCTMKIFDKNSNRIWECGTDKKSIECSENIFEIFKFEFTY